MIRLSLTSRAPLRISDGDGIRLDVAGRPCLPATLLKGRLRAEVERIVKTYQLPACEAPNQYRMCQTEQTCLVCQIFGSPYQEGRLYFEDLIASESPAHVSRMYGARLRQRGTLSAPVMVSSVDSLPAGTRFNGQIRHRLRDRARIGLVVAGLLAINSFGGGYGVGWGVCQVEVMATDLAGTPLPPGVLIDALGMLLKAP